MFVLSLILEKKNTGTVLEWLDVPHTKCQVPRDEERGTISPAPLYILYSLTIQLEQSKFQDRSKVTASL